jgi:hypothetical protein
MMMKFHSDIVIGCKVILWLILSQNESCRISHCLCPSVLQVCTTCSLDCTLYIPFIDVHATCPSALCSQLLAYSFIHGHVGCNKIGSDVMVVACWIAPDSFVLYNHTFISHSPTPIRASETFQL